MTVVSLLEELAAHGIEVWFEGERLRMQPSRGAPAPDLLARAAKSDSELVAKLRADAAQTEKVRPLSYSQQSLWFVHQQAAESSANHVALAVRLLGEIDRRALHDALQALVDRHASLRTTYPVIADVPRQRVAGAAAVSFEAHDVAGIDEAELRRRVQADFQRPFDLDRGPVFRASLYADGPTNPVLLINVHHIAVDAWSLMIMFDDLSKLYHEAKTGAPANLERPVLDFTDYTAWQDEMLSGPEGERLWDYWRKQLAAPRGEVNLPTDRPHPAVQTFIGGMVPIDIPSAVADGMRHLARIEGTTPFVIHLAAFQIFLHRLTGATDIIVGTPTFGRERPEFIRIVGDFVNSVPLRTSLQSRLTFRDLIAQVRRTVLEGLDAQEFPLRLMVHRLRPDRESNRSPLFESFFILQRFEQFGDMQLLFTGRDCGAVVDLGGLRLAPFPFPQPDNQFDFALQLVESHGRLEGVFKYSADLFDEATIRQFAVDYIAIMEAMQQNPDLPLGELPRPARAAEADDRIDRFLQRLRERDISLSLDGEKLKVNAPKGAVDEETRAALIARKAEIVAALRTAANGSDRTGEQLRRIPRSSRLPLSSVQQRLWFFDRMEPGRTQYNIGGGLWITGRLDDELLERALRTVGERHEAFRSRITDTDDGPFIEIDDALIAPLTRVDITSVPSDARREEARNRMTAWMTRPFDLTAGPLVRYCLVRLGPEEHLLVGAMHHIVSDGWSLQVAAKELFEIYEDLATARARPLPPAVIDYVDYAAWEHEQLASGKFRNQLDFWRAELDGAPSILELPTDRPRPAVQSFRGFGLTLTVDSSLLDDVKRLSRSHDATVFMTLLAAFQVLLHRYSGQDDVVVGSPMANRFTPELESVIGNFVNNLVFRGRVGGNPTFVEFLARVKQTALGAFEHAEVPFDLIVDAVRPERGLHHSPIFQVLFVFHSFPTEIPSPAGLKLELAHGDGIGTARFDLAVEVAEIEGKFLIGYEYASDLFDEATILRIHSHYQQILREIVADSTRHVADIPLLGADETQRVLHEWNQTTVKHDRARCIHDMFDAAAREHPDDVAVIAGDETITYRELNERANRLAQLLVRRQVPSGSLIAVCVDRTLDTPVAMLAALKAGAAYVPLDPNHPADRLRYIIDDAGVACAITSARFVPLLESANAPLVLLDGDAAEIASMPSDAPAVAVAPSDRAYVIYTSGSTGRPKGVEVEHHNVVAFLEAMRREPGFTPNDVLLAVTTLSFDIAGLEIWLPLTTGGRVVIASRADVLEGERLMHLIREHGVTVMQATPATWRLMLDAGWTGERRLVALCGGEALPPDLAAALVDRVGALWNMYGPTETTIWSTVSHIVDAAAPITIGRPIHNTRIYVLERSGLPAPIGIPGELCIGGEGVTRGYHNRPDLTSEKFVTITLPDGSVERVYRTGDVARLRADGRIDFLGRRDNQVKVRGYRIELGEIESVLAEDSAVKECVVIVREDSPGDQRIVAYVVPAEGRRFDGETARAALRGRLPEYMIPNAFSELPAMPLTPNGKIDRKALPVPNASPRAAARAEPEIPMTPVQRRVAKVWSDVLKNDRVGLHDNFFDIGGHSLLLIKLHAALKREFTAPLELVELFQWTTVASQATRLSGTAGSTSALKRAQSRAARQTDG